jgi:hypothetical protein
VKMLAAPGSEETRSRWLRFRSICPKCGEARTQRYNQAALLRLLNGGYPVEAYCSVCEEYWPIGIIERVRLGEVAVARPPGER